MKIYIKNYFLLLSLNISIACYSSWSPVITAEVLEGRRDFIEPVVGTVVGYPPRGYNPQAPDNTAASQTSNDLTTPLAGGTSTYYTQEAAGNNYLTFAIIGTTDPTQPIAQAPIANPQAESRTRNRRLLNCFFCCCCEC
ncbi:MAG: hypothetical protein NTZ68_02420 [Candidatus Dependentiae bacterium]|nr:hypothetical protein [Candidatus Dependentiae bacterium]